MPLCNPCPCMSIHLTFTEFGQLNVADLKGTFGNPSGKGTWNPFWESLSKIQKHFAWNQIKKTNHTNKRYLWHLVKVEEKSPSSYEEIWRWSWNNMNIIQVKCMWIYSFLFSITIACHSITCFHVSYSAGA